MRDLAPDVLDRLAREEVVWLCTSRPDGSPHLTPVWFVIEDGAWWTSAAAHSREVAHATSDARVSLALHDGREPVVAEGTATIHHGNAPPDVVARFATEHQGWDITSPEPDGPRALLQVRTHRRLLRGSAR